MFKKAVSLVLLICCTVFCGCSEKNETSVEEESKPLREISSEIVWNDLTLSPITPVCAFEINGGQLDIFPYNDSDFHISMKVIFTSDNKLWSSVKRNYNGSDNLQVYEPFSIVTVENGTTYGYMDRDENSAYLVSTETLPSSYVVRLLEELCNVGI